MLTSAGTEALLGRDVRRRGRRGARLRALQQLCAPILELGEQLPQPQREALDLAFGRAAGHVPNPLFFALAVLSPLSDAAEQQPLLCVVDDAQ